MKALFRLFSLAALLAFSSQSQAQLGSNVIAPDFTFTDINGTSHHLYDILASGKTVFIDVSAAWCSPCWSYHNSHALDSLYEEHGPLGAPNVLATTTNDVTVLFVEGQLTNTAAQLTGTSTGQTQATFTQGNWVTGTTHPIIDLPNNAAGQAFMNDYNINYFPTIYKICPNRIIEEVGAKNSKALYAYVGSCPGVATQAVDAIGLTYVGKEFACGNLVDVSVTFQNHGTAPLTGATVTLTDAAMNPIATQNVTGTVNSYDIATVNFGSVTIPPATSSLIATIVAAGDATPTDNVINKDLYMVNIKQAPHNTDCETPLSSDYYVEDPDNNGGWFRVTGAQLSGGNPGAGGSTASMLVNFYNIGPGELDYFYLPKTSLVTTNGATVARVTWNRAAIQYTDAQTPLTNDEIAFQVSSDCGATWTDLWKKAGAALATRAGGTDKFYGSGNTTTGMLIGATDWVNDTVNVASYIGQSELLMRFKSTSDYGNNAYLDNINVELISTVGIAEVKNISKMEIYPNPVSTVANIRFELTNPSDVNVEVINAAGQSVYTNAQGKMNAGSQTISFSTEELAAGVYMVNIRTNGHSMSQMLNVVK